MDRTREDAAEQITRNDPRTCCDRCQDAQHEDLLHRLWMCPASVVIWEWIFLVMTEAGKCSSRFTASPAQGLLGTKIHDAGRQFPEKLWEIVRGHGMWEIWLARDKLVMDNITVSREEIIHKTWFSVRQYLDIGWDDLLVKVAGGKLSQEQAEQAFAKDFGPVGCLFNFDQNRLLVPFTPFGMT
jgi:hypothetical protein